MARVGGLRGLVGQRMVLPRKDGNNVTRVFPPGSYVFEAPSGGLYEVAGWSPGYAAYSTNPSVSGSFALRRIRLGAGQRINIVVGQADGMFGNSGTGVATPTVVTFPDGKTMTMGVGDPTVPTAATASGGDINIDGNISPASNIGAAAPSYGIYLGGGQTTLYGRPRSPGGGAAFISTTAPGGDGQVQLRKIS